MSSANGEDIEKLTVACPCDHPSHVIPCGKPMRAGEEKCPACKNHVEGANVP